MAISTDATSIGTATGGVSTISWSHTCASGSVLFVSVGWQGAPTVTGVTYNGAAMTELWDINTSNVAGSAGYILKTPSVGTNTIEVTLSASADLLIAGARSYLGVDTTTPNRTVYTATSLVNNATVTVVDSQSGDMVVDTAAVAVTSTINVGTGETSVNEDDGINGGSTSWGQGERSATGGSTVMSWTGTFDFGSIGATALIPAAGGGGGSTRASYGRQRMRLA